MDIECFKDLIVNVNLDGTQEIDINMPSFVYATEGMNQYEVQPHEEGRIDLVMESIYDDYNYGHLDVILHLNGIDNPLNIKAGSIIVYPPVDNADTYRWNRQRDPIESKEMVARLSKPNKTTSVDPARQYSLPPTANPNPRPAVRNENNAIVAGGL